MKMREINKNHILLKLTMEKEELIETSNNLMKELEKTKRKNATKLARYNHINGMINQINNTIAIIELYKIEV